MILIKINILTTMLVVLAAVVSVCVCGWVGVCGGGVFSDVWLDQLCVSIEAYVRQNN